MSVIKVNKDNFEEIKNSEKKVLIDFYADWCGPCKMLAPVIDAIANERDDIIIGKVNVDENNELAAEFGISSIPTMIIFEGGNEIKRLVGFKPKDALLAELA